MAIWPERDLIATARELARRERDIYDQTSWPAVLDALADELERRIDAERGLIAARLEASDNMRKGKR